MRNGAVKCQFLYKRRSYVESIVIESFLQNAKMLRKPCLGTTPLFPHRFRSLIESNRRRIRIATKVTNL